MSPTIVPAYCPRSVSRIWCRHGDPGWSPAFSLSWENGTGCLGRPMKLRFLRIEYERERERDVRERWLKKELQRFAEDLHEYSAEYACKETISKPGKKSFRGNYIWHWHKFGNKVPVPTSETRKISSTQYFFFSTQKDFVLVMENNYP